MSFVHTILEVLGTTYYMYIYIYRFRWNSTIRGSFDSKLFALSCIQRRRSVWNSFSITHWNVNTCDIVGTFNLFGHISGVMSEIGDLRLFIKHSINNESDFSYMLCEYLRFARWKCVLRLFLGVWGVYFTELRTI